MRLYYDAREDQYDDVSRRNAECHAIDMRLGGGLRRCGKRFMQDDGIEHSDIVKDAIGG